MSPASMGAEIFTCCRTMEPTLAAVIFVAAVLALVRALLPPKVGQSAAAPVSEVVDTAAQPQKAATAQVRRVLWINRMPYTPNGCGVFYFIYQYRRAAKFDQNPRCGSINAVLVVKWA